VKNQLARRQPDGFTLIELVISVALMSVILATAYACLSAGIKGREVVDARSDVAQNARVAMALISADLRGAFPLSDESAFVGMQRMIGDVRADNLDFATRHYTPRRPREGDLCEVSYFLRKEPESELFRLWRRRDPTPDPEPFAGGQREEIARGLKGMLFEYYDGLEWFSEWGDPDGRRSVEGTSLIESNLSGMPEAVRITLLFDPEPARAGQHPSTRDASNPPPLVFQTIVRLNLATVSNESASGGSGEDASTNPGDGATGSPGVGFN
jgi:prepilin-type N-terminal cleavage/methylation domain-containing protein